MARLIRNKQGIPSTLLTRFLNSPSSLLTLPYYSTSKRSLQTLAYEEIQANPNKPYTHTAFILHGLLGSARNWQWRMVLVDLRNHGNSAEMEGLGPPHDLLNAAKDLGNLINSKGWDSPDVVIGHSMGGKVALQFAKSCGNRDYGENVKLPKQLWVLDSVPGEVTSDNSDGEVEKVLQTLQSLPSTVPSRKWLVNHMLELGFSKSLSEWVGTNLKRAGGEDTWAFNLEGSCHIGLCWSTLRKGWRYQLYVRRKVIGGMLMLLLGLKGLLVQKEMDLQGRFQFMFFPVLATGSMWTIPRAFLRLWHPS
ncbi:hypothetical protein ES332_A04G086600v1 [Gossypium tomentosum]|uniref:AB hydrolase-1 domain-containing protein n=1 Tax=Gossypium tomentosum TaxID=34277 RepID=A0A5D2QX30_GOSTO|nr:hypothetical protein ES332_A04G086600v1 [Gossypium tomentosum]